MIKLTKENWDHIQRANRVWNDKIDYLDDITHYGKRDEWKFPEDDLGDCEDYAIAKRQALESFDIPGFFATCWTKKESGIWTGYHGVLVIDTDRGDFILSNGIDEVWGYDELSWKWDMRECEDKLWRKILS